MEQTKMKKEGWIGVDLDGTLAYYDKWRGIDHIGEPIPAMVKRVRQWLKNGDEVRIFTARVGTTKDDRDPREAMRYVDEWVVRHFGISLPITNLKDFGMIEMWDDRCVQVIPNTGVTAREQAIIECAEIADRCDDGQLQTNAKDAILASIKECL